MIKFDTVKAVSIGSQTLVGYMKSDGRPLDHGNCFSVTSETGEHYKILNFNVENLNYLISIGISMPVDIHVMSDRHAVIHDARIPHEWYSKTFCTTCCPESMLPIAQRLANAREVLQGVRTYHEAYVSIAPGMRPVLPTGGDS